MEKHINAPLKDETIKELRSGDYVYISGTIYTARDAAHKRMYESMLANEAIPMNLENNIIYYMGAVTGQRRPADWFSRPDNKQPNG